jgi:hypothetical protein
VTLKGFRSRCGFAFIFFEEFFFLWLFKVEALLRRVALKPDGGRGWEGIECDG